MQTPQVRESGKIVRAQKLWRYIQQLEFAFQPGVLLQNETNSTRKYSLQQEIIKATIQSLFTLFIRQC